MNASASRVADISLRALSLFHTLFFLFSLLFFASRGFFCHRGSGCYMYNTIHHTQGTRGKRAHKRNSCCFFCPTPLPSLPFPSFTS